MISKVFNPSPFPPNMMRIYEENTRIKEALRFLCWNDNKDSCYPNEVKFVLKTEELINYMELYNSQREMNNKNNSINFNTFKNNLQNLKDISYQVVESDKTFCESLYSPKLFISKQGPEIEQIGRTSTKKQKEINHFMKRHQNFQTNTCYSPMYGIANSYNYSYLERKNVYQGWKEEFQAKYLTIEDIHFVDNETPLLRIPIYFVYNNEQYIEIYVLSLYTLGKVLNYILKYPVWGSRYEYYIEDYKLTPIDIHSMFIELYYSNIIHPFSEIHIKPTFQE